MANLRQHLEAGRTLTVIGFDDAPFVRAPGMPVSVAGIVCQGTRFEGMVWGQATQDGTDGTQVLSALLTGSKFASQVHLVLTDGLTLGGLNVVDLPALHEAVGVPCVAVMRRRPDLTAMRGALNRLPDPEGGWATLQRAGPIHEVGDFVFQVVGAPPEHAAAALAALTDRGRVPECLRLAHLIGAAVQTGQSSRRA